MIPKFIVEKEPFLIEYIENEIIAIESINSPNVIKLEVLQILKKYFP